MGGKIDIVLLQDKTQLKGQVNTLFRLINGKFEEDRSKKDLQFILFTSKSPASTPSCEAAFSPFPSVQRTLWLDEREKWVMLRAYPKNPM
jgi:hypothetical protein